MGFDFGLFFLFEYPLRDLGLGVTGGAQRNPSLKMSGFCFFIHVGKILEPWAWCPSSKRGAGKRVRVKAYPAERKEALLRRMMPPENKIVSELARETGSN
ncbi:MAG: hypothetical protein ACOH2K_16045 [Burkholderiaceae bacterium]